MERLLETSEKVGDLSQLYMKRTKIECVKQLYIYSIEFRAGTNP